MSFSPIQFGFSLPPIGPSMGEIGAKMMDSLGSVPVSSIQGPPSSFYTDSFQYLRTKKGEENPAQENQEVKPDPPLQLQQNTASKNSVNPTTMPGNEKEALNIPESATLSNSPTAIQNDMLTAQQYNQSMDGYQAIQDVSPV